MQLLLLLLLYWNFWYLGNPPAFTDTGSTKDSPCTKSIASPSALFLFTSTITISEANPDIIIAKAALESTKPAPTIDILLSLYSLQTTPPNYLVIKCDYITYNNNYQQFVIILLLFNSIPILKKIIYLLAYIIHCVVK